MYNCDCLLHKVFGRGFEIAQVKHSLPASEMGPTVIIGWIITGLFTIPRHPSAHARSHVGFRFVYDAHFHTEPSTLGFDVLLNKIEAHGNER